MYITPQNISSIARLRAGGVIGMMSPKPVADSEVKLRNSNSTHVRVWSAFTAAVKLPGYQTWHTEYANAKPTPAT